MITALTTMNFASFLQYTGPVYALLWKKQWVMRQNTDEFFREDNTNALETTCLVLPTLLNIVMTSNKENQKQIMDLEKYARFINSWTKMDLQQKQATLVK